MSLLPKYARAVLDEAITAAGLTNCAIAEEHQAAMRLYLNTWVLGPLELIARADDGDERAQRRLRNYNHW